MLQICLKSTVKSYTAELLKAQYTYVQGRITTKK
jgi:hypothetical protein